MPSSILSEDDWDTLLGRIKERKCTPFLGAGANFGLLSTGDGIAAKWSEKHGFPLKSGKGDLASVAQFLAIHKPDPMWPKEEILREFHERIVKIDLRAKLTGEKNPIVALAKLPFEVYMTTNYDSFMMQALELHGKHPRLELCRWNEYVRKHHKSVFSTKPRFEPSETNPVVFHLHGHQCAAETLVLTEDDYLDFLISISRDSELLPPRIQRALTYSSLLFVGYRLADLNFRVLFRSVFQGMESGLRRINIAVQLPPEDGPAAQAYLDKYFHNEHVKVYWGDANQFAEELLERWGAYR